MSAHVTVTDNDMIDFEEEISRHEHFFGRADILKRLHDLLIGEGTRGRGWVILEGSPGIGKSAIVQRLLATLPEGTPYHLIRRGNRGWDRPAVIVQNLCARIEKISAQRTNTELPLEARLGDLLRRVSKYELVERGKRLFLVLDGLDEVASNDRTRSGLEAYVPSVLPRGVVILCATRPMYPQLEWLMQHSPRCINLNSEDWKPSNEAAVRAFWEHHAPRMSPPLDTEFVREAVLRADGNLLHAVLLKEWIEDQPLASRLPTNIPRGVTGFLNVFWEDFQSLDGPRSDLVNRGLAFACAAREALPVSVFGELLGSSDPAAGDKLLRFIRPLLIPEHVSHWNGAPAYRPYHASFREFFAEKVGHRYIRECHRHIAKTIAAWPTLDGDPLWRGYALRHAVTHHLEACDVRDAYRLCLNVVYLSAKLREVGFDAVERDFEATICAVDEENALDLSAILAALRAETNNLRASPESLSSLLYNRLRSAGWTHARIDARLCFDEAPPRLRLLHGVRLGPTQLRPFLGHQKAVVACVVRPDGKSALSASEDRTLRLWALHTGDCTRELPGHSDAITACALSADGATAISTSSDATTRVWDLVSGECVETIDNGDKPATACALTPNGERLVIGSNDGQLVVWDRASRQRLHTLRDHSDYVTACLIATDGKLVSASRDGTARLWDLEAGLCIHTYSHPGKGEDGWLNAIALFPGENRALLAAGDGSLSCWDLVTGEQTTLLRPATGRIDACTVLHGGHYALCGMSDGSVIVWDLARRERVLAFQAHDGPIACFAIPGGGQRLLTASHDRSLRLWELGGLESLAQTTRHDAPLVACALSSDRNIALSASEDGVVKVWDVSTGACLHTRVVQDDPAHLCALLSNGDTAVLGPQSSQLPTLRPTCGALLPDRIHAVLARQDGRFEHKDIHTQKIVRVIQGSGEHIVDCAISTDGQRVVVVSKEGALHVYCLQTSKCLGTLHASSGFRCVTMAEKLICAGDEDGNLWLIADDTDPASLTPKSSSRAWTESEIKQLCDTLTALYSRIETIRALAHDAGLNEGRLYLNGTAREAWGSVLDEAKKQGRLDKLFALARKEYAEAQAILELERARSNGP